MSTTFLGSPGLGNLRGDESFPHAARGALANSQLRRNIGHATQTIRGKRLRASPNATTGKTCAPRAVRSNRT